MMSTCRGWRDHAEYGSILSDRIETDRYTDVEMNETVDGVK